MQGPGVSAIAAAAVTALGTGLAQLWVGRVPCPLVSLAAGRAGALGLPSHVRTVLWLRAVGTRQSLLLLLAKSPYPLGRQQAARVRGWQGEGGCPFAPNEGWMCWILLR